MDYRLQLNDLSKSQDIQKLVGAISELADQLDVMYSETAPNGAISARIGRICIYKNGATYETWQNIDGATTWQQLGAGGIQSVTLGSFTRDISLASGTQAITGVGFQPKVVIFFATVSSGVGLASWGFDIASDQITLFDAYSSVADSYGFNISDSIRMRASAADVYAGEISSFDTDGFTMNWTKSGSPTGTLNVVFLAIK